MKNPVFKIDRFISWCRSCNASESEINEVLERKDWGKYDGMTIEEVKKHETKVMRSWFAMEEE